MKLRKLLPLLLAVALTACAPIASPTVSSPTLQQITATTAPASYTPAAEASTVALTPSSSDEPATKSAPRPTLLPLTATPTGLAFPIGTPTEAATFSTASTPTSVPTDILGPAWGHQTKFSGCLITGPFPDPACTPGDIFASATKDQVCTSGYSSSVRNVSSSEKDQVYIEYGIVSHSAGQYEVDHFVPLELGGSNDVSNLWPEPADPTPGFHQKDEVENYLHDQVCQHSTMTLSQAQLEIATNWLAVYATMTGGGSTQPQPTPVQSNTQAPLATAPPSATGFILTQLTSPVARGGNASATIQTGAGVACSIGYVTPSGNRSTAQGLVPETADGNGICAWTWKISSTTKPGTGTVTITAGGSAQSVPIVIQ